jgi:hypothetical protein
VFSGGFEVVRIKFEASISNSKEMHAFRGSHKCFGSSPKISRRSELVSRRFGLVWGLNAKVEGVARVSRLPQVFRVIPESIAKIGDRLKMIRCKTRQESPHSVECGLCSVEATTSLKHNLQELTGIPESKLIRAKDASFGRSLPGFGRMGGFGRRLAQIRANGGLFCDLRFLFYSFHVGSL